MTLMEKQNKARKEFIQNWLNEELILVNFNNRELIVETDNQEFPYIRLTLTPLDEERGDEKITELIERQNYYEDKQDKRRLRKLCEMFNIK